MSLEKRTNERHDRIWSNYMENKKEIDQANKEIASKKKAKSKALEGKKIMKFEKKESLKK